MKKDKKSFLLYCEQIEIFEQLDDEKAGQLIKHIFRYVNDQDPESEDLLLNLAFTPIKQSLKRDLKKYESIKEERRESGRAGNLKRYNPDIYKDYVNNKLTLEEAENLAKSRKSRKSRIATLAIAKDSYASLAIANLAVNDNDNVNVIVKKEKVEKEKSAAAVGGDLLKKSYSQNGVLKNKDLELLLLSPTFEAWRNLVCSQNSIQFSEINELIKEFIIHTETQGTVEQSPKECQIWFTRWVRKKIGSKEKFVAKHSDPSTPPDNSGNYIFHNGEWRDTRNLSPAQKRRLEKNG